MRLKFYPRPQGETIVLPPTGGKLEGGSVSGAAYLTVHNQLKPSVDVERITARIALRSARLAAFPVRMAGQ